MICPLPTLHVSMLRLALAARGPPCSRTRDVILVLWGQGPVSIAPRDRNCFLVLSPPDQARLRDPPHHPRQANRNMREPTCTSHFFCEADGRLWDFSRGSEVHSDMAQRMGAPLTKNLLGIRSARPVNFPASAPRCFTTTALAVARSYAARTCAGTLRPRVAGLGNCFVLKMRGAGGSIAFVPA